ncbi:anhydro-N-acetylmuramic acid kinase [Pseudorhodoferax sp.]|uniref:anhydro-N-acetylmuramic acid kinase n=1 Tax=Pseudorhodoferax sp. TaxID=1993553 RepID=UPI002DD630FC|nr:anhydro-N-acetylmuramic acid kinase [Pseudorhodoferax sp.]
MPAPLLYAGLMSGTSMDGVDGVLASFDPATQRPLHVLAHAHRGFADKLAAELLALNTAGPDELHRAALAGNRLMQVYAEVVAELLARATCVPMQVSAVGAHGQTVRHRPQAFGGPGYTLQLANGALLAELCGITTVCDFRSADLAAGGQGAPLVPAFHAGSFAASGEDVAVLNVGGIANLTLLPADDRAPVRGFDTGPGNVLLDLWCREKLGCTFDAGGALAARGTVQPALLRGLLDEPFFALPPPKSTGRDLFHAEWLAGRLAKATELAPTDVLATLAELTVHSVVDALTTQMPSVRRLLVCGGGAFNTHLMRRWQALLPAVAVQTTAAAGIAPDQVEALAFAWLAACRMNGRPASLPAVTGARGPRVLGAVYAAPAG